MRDWGPALASVRVGRLDATRLAAIGLQHGPKHCVVSVAFEYPLGHGETCVAPGHVLGRRTCVDLTGTWSCVIDRDGAYSCPLRHEPDRIPLEGKNATIDSRGVLRLDVPLSGTRRPRRLAWQGYPRRDGWVEPWGRSGHLLAGLRFDSTYEGGGTCDFGGSELVSAKSSVRCLSHGLYQVDPCFAPPGRWNHRGGIVACGEEPGATTFGRFVIGPPSYKVIDFPDLKLGANVGAMYLGDPRARVVGDYAAIGHPFHPQVTTDGIAQGYFALHHSRVFVAFRDGMLNEIDFSTRFYRTWDGFGVGSRIPLGPCHRTATSACQHRWHGFVWNAWTTNRPCSCWVKVGDGTRSLPVTAANYLKPWVFLYVRRGRVTRIFMAQKFVD